MTPEVDYFRAQSRARSFLQTAMAIAALSAGAFILAFILVTGVLNQLGCGSFAPGSGPAACGLP